MFADAKPSQDGIWNRKPHPGFTPYFFPICEGGDRVGETSP